MGLTLHFTLKSPDTTSHKEARSLVEKLHAKAQELPFRLVTEVFELEGEACEFEHGRTDVPLPVLLSGGRYLQQGEENWVSVTPTDMIAFLIVVGEGCEPAVFGLAMYPELVTAPMGNGWKRNSPAGRGNRFARRSTPAIPKWAARRIFSAAI